MLKNHMVVYAYIEEDGVNQEYAVILDETRIDYMMRNLETGMFEIQTDGVQIKAHKVVICDTFADACNETLNAGMKDPSIQVAIQTRECE